MLYERYQEDLKRKDFQYDPRQEKAIRYLQQIYDELVSASPESESARPNFLKRLLSSNNNRNSRVPVRGLYLWGSVGRGKTYLVDMFYANLPIERKQRIHFHSFMQQIHGALGDLQEQQNPLQRVAGRFAEKARLICLDEFFVSDITDAMLLSGLLQALFTQGVTLITTSNSPPDDLYKDGLQRARFLPAIDLIKTHMEIMNLDGSVDYRLRYLETAEIYHYPLDDKAEGILMNTFNHVSPEEGHPNGHLEIAKRLIATRRQADSVVWFDFAAICDGPRSQTDYLEIARCFHTVLISDIPIMDWQMENQARRFLNLVDAFYDHNVTLIISAAAPITEIYQGNKLTFEFQRVVSRLQEMQSHDYLGREHLP